MTDQQRLLVALGWIYDPESSDGYCLRYKTSDVWVKDVTWGAAANAAEKARESIEKLERELAEAREWREWAEEVIVRHEPWHFKIEETEKIANRAWAKLNLTIHDNTKNEAPP